MTSENYNGWTNYETWVTALWIDNDEGSYNAAGDLADECLSDGHDKYQAADVFKDWAEGEYIDPIVEDGPAGLHVDLLRAAWSEVNWTEIAGHKLEDARERAEEAAE